MDKRGCDTAVCQMAVILLSFWTVGGVVGPHGSKMKNWRFCSYGNFGDKIILFVCLPGTQGRDSFLRHLDLSLAPNKTNGGVKSQ